MSAGLLAALAADAAWAQREAPYPVRPVRVVVPFTPGGSSDIVARLLGQKLSELWGQQFVIDNRGGAGGAIGAETVVNSAPDGYTLLFTNPGPALHHVLLRKKPPYALKDLAPVVYIGYSPNILVASLKLPAANLKELIAYAKANPGKINWASPGAGSNPHIALEVLKAATRIDVVHVPYKGAVQAMTDIAAGTVDVQYTSLISAEPFIKSARLKILGVSGPKRLLPIPYAPTFAEQGLAAADSTLWFGLQAASATPRARVLQVNGGVNKVLQQLDVRQRFEDLAIEVEGGPPEKFGALIRAEAARLAPLAKSGVVEIE